MATNPSDSPKVCLLTPQGWEDYELLDSGEGRRLERYGNYIFVRPEHQAVWERALPLQRWESAHGIFQPTGEESGGRWQFIKPVKTPWKMHYKEIQFLAFAASSRHMGVFPEQASHWSWIEEKIRQHRIKRDEPIRVLNLFGYTGLATLIAAQAGAHVTHVDASKKSIMLARENQELSGLSNRPIRWLVDDAFKFVRKEFRRAVRYDGILLDPPKFGRGPQGQVWELFESLPELLHYCRLLLSDQPIFFVLTTYAILASSLSLGNAMQDVAAGMGGQIEMGELTLKEKSTGRLLSPAIFARWGAG